MKVTTSLAVLGLAATAAHGASIESASSSNLRRDASSSSRTLGRRLASSDDLEKRGLSHNVFSGTATHYGAAVSRGACGSYVSASSYVVALNTAQYGNPDAVSPWCGKKLSINAGGQTITATVVDACPTCSYGDLDMSTGLFTEFATLSDGVFDMSWHLAGAVTGSSSSSSSKSNSKSKNNSNDDDNNDKTTTKSKTKSTYTPPTTTPTPSSTYSLSLPTLPLTTTGNASDTASSAPTLTLPTASVPTDSAEPTFSNLVVMNQALQGMLQMANAGRN